MVAGILGGRARQAGAHPGPTPPSGAVDLAWPRQLSRGTKRAAARRAVTKVERNAARVAHPH